jgi:hypothetical protein
MRVVGKNKCVDAVVLIRRRRRRTEAVKLTPSNPDRCKMDIPATFSNELWFFFFEKPTRKRELKEEFSMQILWGGGFK